MIFGTLFEQATSYKMILDLPPESLFYNVADDFNDFTMIWADFLHSFRASYPMYFQFVGFRRVTF